jgi:hypothetical protein
MGERLTFALVGIFAVVYGYGQILRGKPIYTNWRGSDISGQFVMFLGALFIVAAIFPWGRIRSLWETDGKKHHR